MNIPKRCSELLKHARIGLSKIPVIARLQYAEQCFVIVSTKLHIVFSNLLGDTTELHFIMCTVGLELAIRVCMNPKVDFSDELEQCCVVLPVKESLELVHHSDNPNVKKCLIPNKRTGLYPIGVSQVEILYGDDDEVYRQVVRIEPLPSKDTIPLNFEDIDTFRQFLKKVELDIPLKWQSTLMEMINSDDTDVEYPIYTYDPHFADLRQRLHKRLAKCDGCNKFAYHTLLCSRCKKARYCGKQCQTAHWKKTHKSRCLSLYW